MRAPSDAGGGTGPAGGQTPRDLLDLRPLWEGRRALVCDRVAVAREHLVDMLQQVGMRVWEAPDLEAALAVLMERKPHLVVTEMLLDDARGRVVIERLRGRAPQTPIVVCSALSSRAAVTEARRAGAVDFLAKPVWAQRLAAALAVAREGPQAAG